MRSRLRRGDATKKRRKNAAAAFEREQDIFKNGVIDINRGRLKFSADAQAVDLRIR